MMERRNFVTFDADFPDDTQWNEYGDLLIPGGRIIAKAICEKLQERGVICSEVYQHSYYGWAFDANIDNFRVWCLLQVGNAWLFSFEEQKPLTSRLLGLSNTTGFDNFQMKVHDILTGDKRFSNVLWYTRADYESGRRGSPSPH